MISAIGPPQDFPKQVPGHGHFGQLGPVGTRPTGLARAGGAGGAWELGQDAVAQEFDDAPLVPGDPRIDRLLAVRLERGQRARLVRAHEAGVAEAAKTAASLRSMDARPEHARGSPVPGAMLCKSARKAQG